MMKKILKTALYLAIFLALSITAFAILYNLDIKALAVILIQLIFLFGYVMRRKLIEINKSLNTVVEIRQ